MFLESNPVFLVMVDIGSVIIHICTGNLTCFDCFMGSMFIMGLEIIFIKYLPDVAYYIELILLYYSLFV